MIATLLSYLGTFSVAVIAGLFLAAAAYAWFMLPVFGHYVGVGLVAIGVGIFGVQQGDRIAQSRCNAAELQSQLDAAHEDLRTITEQAALERKQTDELNTLVQNQSESINALRDLLGTSTKPEEPAVVSPAPTLPPNKCAAPAAAPRASRSDVERLRNTRK